MCHGCAAQLKSAGAADQCHRRRGTRLSVNVAVVVKVAPVAMVSFRLLESVWAATCRLPLLTVMPETLFKAALAVNASVPTRHGEAVCAALGSADRQNRPGSIDTEGAGGGEREIAIGRGRGAGVLERAAGENEVRRGIGRSADRTVHAAVGQAGDAQYAADNRCRARVTAVGSR